MEWCPIGVFLESFSQFLGDFLQKVVCFIAKIEGNGEVFDVFEKGWVVIALSWRFDHEAHGDHEEGKILDRINRILFYHELHAWLITYDNHANAYHVKELLGHDSLRSIQAYLDLTIVELKKAHKKHHPREKGGRR